MDWLYTLLVGSTAQGRGACSDGLQYRPVPAEKFEIRYTTSGLRRSVCGTELLEVTLSVKTRLLQSTVTHSTFREI